MSLSVSPKAANQIRKALAQRGGGVGLRVSVKTSGCSGYAYALEFADAAAPEDLSFASEGVTLLVDAKSLPLVDGTRLDWVREGLNGGARQVRGAGGPRCSLERFGVGLDEFDGQTGRAARVGRLADRLHDPGRPGQIEDDSGASGRELTEAE
mgnify:CR=1 FL=1